MNKAFSKRKLTSKELKNSVHLFDRWCKLVGICFTSGDDDCEYDYNPDDPAHY